ncbi:regenerating islet-derived protein 4 [Dugong dugon]
MDIIMRPSSATGCFYHRSNCFGYFQKLKSWSDAEVRNLTHRQQWQWIDGALYLYRTWSGKSMCWNKHYAEMSSNHNFLPWNNNECNTCQHFLCKHRPQSKTQDLAKPCAGKVCPSLTDGTRSLAITGESLETGGRDPGMSL